MHRVYIPLLNWVRIFIDFLALVFEMRALEKKKMRDPEKKTMQVINCSCCNIKTKFLSGAIDATCTLVSSIRHQKAQNTLCTHEGAQWILSSCQHVMFMLVSWTSVWHTTIAKNDSFPRHQLSPFANFHLSVWRLY